MSIYAIATSNQIYHPINLCHCHRCIAAIVNSTQKLGIIQENQWIGIA